jgi:hypothetical protein
MKETWAEAMERQRKACGDPTPWELVATGLRIPGPPRSNRKLEWAYKPRKLEEGI